MFDMNIHKNSMWLSLICVDLLNMITKGKYGLYVCLDLCV